jgi:hypothetical protein
MKLFFIKDLQNYLFIQGSSPSLPIRGLQRDVVYLGWPIGALVYSPNAGGGGSCGVSANEYSCTVQLNFFGDLTPSVFNLWFLLSGMLGVVSVMKNEKCPPPPHRHFAEYSLYKSKIWIIQYSLVGIRIRMWKVLFLLGDMSNMDLILSILNIGSHCYP